MQTQLLSRGSSGWFQETSDDVNVGSRLKLSTAIALWYVRHRTHSLIMVTESVDERIRTDGAHCVV